MVYREGERYRHPGKPEWGVGQVLSAAENRVLLFFVGGGRRTIVVDRVRLEPVAAGEGQWRCLDALEGLDWQRARRNLYVVRLDPRVLRIERFRTENPTYNPELPCVYVGITGLSPEERFQNHLRGHKASWFVKEFGRKLMPERYRRFNPMPDELARYVEPDYSKWLRLLGYAVWSN
ncbi:MAG: hypothetical protein Kow0062_19610 [Acidobacteriota bacterium]